MKNTSRRNFLKTVSIGGAILATPLSILASDEKNEKNVEEIEETEDTRCGKIHKTYTALNPRIFLYCLASIKKHLKNINVGVIDRYTVKRSETDPLAKIRMEVKFTKRVRFPFTGGTRSVDSFELAYHPEKPLSDEFFKKLNMIHNTYPCYVCKKSETCKLIEEKLQKCDCEAYCDYRVRLSGRKEQKDEWIYSKQMATTTWS